LFLAVFILSSWMD